MIEVENTDVNIVRNLIPMRNHMPASAYGLKAISDWFILVFLVFFFFLCVRRTTAPRDRDCIFLVGNLSLLGIAYLACAYVCTKNKLCMLYTIGRP